MYTRLWYIVNPRRACARVSCLSVYLSVCLSVSVEPHLRAETLLRGDLIFHEFIHKLTWPIMRQPHALRSLFITLHCVTLLRLNLVQSVYDAVSRIRAKHVCNMFRICAVKTSVQRDFF